MSYPMAGEFGVYPEWKGLIVIPSRAADQELAFEGLTLRDVLEILELGVEPAEGKTRKEGVCERCMRKGRKNYKVVAAKSYNFALEEECWILAHVKGVR